jgi:hypothetical protein
MIYMARFGWKNTGKKKDGQEGRRSLDNSIFSKKTEGERAYIFRPPV